MNKLVLFDIDRTLLREHLKSKESPFSVGFRKVYGIVTSLKVINYQGMTDQEIIIAVLKKHGLDEAEIKAKLKECVNVIEEYSIKEAKFDIDVYEGVPELLDAWEKENILLGLINGNLKMKAR